MLSFPLRTLVSSLCLVSLITLPSCQKKNNSSDPPPPPPPATGPEKPVAAPNTTIVTTPNLTVAGPVFQQVCQAAGGLQRPALGGTGPAAPGASTAIACKCGGTVTTLDQFAQGDFKTDASGRSFEAKCAAQRDQSTIGNPVVQNPQQHPGVSTDTNQINVLPPPTGTGSVATTSPLSPASQQAGRQIFANACRSLAGVGAYYFDEAAGAAEPQCLCGQDTTTLSYFLADTVAGYLANVSDQTAKAFVHACQAAIGASVAGGSGTRLPGSGVSTSSPVAGSCDCHNENDYPSCAGCALHNWCVLRDAYGRLITYTDRTAVSDGLANDDCSNDCNFLTSRYGAGRCNGY